LIRDGGVAGACKAFLSKASGCGLEDCGMRWLREIHVDAAKETFTAIVNRILPVLADGASSATGERGADLHAHMGWADYLRIRAKDAIRRDALLP
jgi:hypothetical protein